MEGAPILPRRHGARGFEIATRGPALARSGVIRRGTSRAIRRCRIGLPARSRRNVPNLEERVALLEGRVQEQAAHMTDLRAIGTEVRQELGALRQELHESTGALRQELRQSIGEVREELHQLGGELRAGMRQLRDEMNRRFEKVDQRFDAMDRRFGWLVGMMVTGFLAVIGTVAGAFWGLLQVLQSTPR